MKISQGQKAPDFSLPDQNGERHSLSEYAGKWILLYFYPKDNTPGCTIEACTIRDSFSQFAKEGAVVLGVSADSVASHKKFEEKHKLPFTLLSDESKDMLSAYGVYGNRKFMGKTFLGVTRSSVLIDPKGNVAKVYEKVKPDIHASEVLDDIRELRSQ